MSRVTLLIGVGVAVGLGVYIWAAQFVSNLLYGVEPGDRGTLVGAVFVLSAVGAVAGWLPANRASRIDPSAVLRET